ncbi:hypothetical protein OPV22_004742 [Ensete ventricosum]|uniref:Large ribosomal subunit protein eL24-related N-terminal domain-containing protein n=1 Tax=Ensete ventricosum TaxID=4639 RepID=A0AAV8RGX3_ENSVE|nr:hypothetical protein OPV22_004742 [Ensete ventricosum]
MVLKTQLCCFSGAKIYPGKGITFVGTDSQFFFLPTQNSSGTFTTVWKILSRKFDYCVYTRDPCSIGYSC